MVEEHLKKRAWNLGFSDQKRVQIEKDAKAVNLSPSEYLARLHSLAARSFNKRSRRCGRAALVAKAR